MPEFQHSYSLCSKLKKWMNMNNITNKCQNKRQILESSHAHKSQSNQFVKNMVFSPYKKTIFENLLRNYPQQQITRENNFSKINAISGKIIKQSSSGNNNQSNNKGLKRSFQQREEKYKTIKSIVQDNYGAINDKSMMKINKGKSQYNGRKSFVDNKNKQFNRIKRKKNNENINQSNYEKDNIRVYSSKDVDKTLSRNNSQSLIRHNLSKKIKLNNPSQNIINLNIKNSKNIKNNLNIDNFSNLNIDNLSKNQQIKLLSQIQQQKNENKQNIRKSINKLLSLPSSNNNNNSRSIEYLKMAMKKTINNNNFNSNSNGNRNFNSNGKNYKQENKSMIKSDNNKLRVNLSKKINIKKNKLLNGNNKSGINFDDEDNNKSFLIREVQQIREKSWNQYLPQKLALNNKGNLSRQNNDNEYENNQEYKFNNENDNNQKCQEEQQLFTFDGNKLIRQNQPYCQLNGIEQFSIQRQNQYQQRDEEQQKIQNVCLDNDNKNDKIKINQLINTQNNNNHQNHSIKNQTQIHQNCNMNTCEYTNNNQISNQIQNDYNNTNIQLKKPTNLFFNNNNHQQQSSSTTSQLLQILQTISNHTLKEQNNNKYYSKILHLQNIPTTKQQLTSKEQLITKEQLISLQQNKSTQTIQHNYTNQQLSLQQHQLSFSTLQQQQLLSSNPILSLTQKQYQQQYSLKYPKLNQSLNQQQSSLKQQLLLQLATTPSSNFINKSTQNNHNINQLTNNNNTNQLTNNNNTNSHINNNNNNKSTNNNNKNTTNKHSYNPLAFQSKMLTRSKQLKLHILNKPSIRLIRKKHGYHLTHQQLANLFLYDSQRPKIKAYIKSLNNNENINYNNLPSSLQPITIFKQRQLTKQQLKMILVKYFQQEQHQQVISKY